VPGGSEFAARVYAAINARDRGAIRSLSAPDIVVGTTVEAYRGPEAVLEWLDEGDDAFDDFTVELLDVEELAGHVVASMRQRGRGKASGADVDHRFTHVWTLRDGRRYGCSPSPIATTPSATPSEARAPEEPATSAAYRLSARERTFRSPDEQALLQT
jgi:ketosteroid isomerase-like protein